MTRCLLFLLLCCSLSAAAQLNTTLRDNFSYGSTGVNDVWGYVAPDGTEYAIVGLVTGVSFVSLADPDNLVEVARIPGDFSAWRDMKTYGEYAYSVADQGSEGITVFDLRNLPNEVTFTRNTYDIPGSSTPFIRAHNLYIDEDRGVIYTAGGTRNIRDGGILMFDVTQTPTAPTLVGLGPPIYSHDVYVLNDTMYASEIYRGELAVYDVADFDNISLLGRTPTPFSFTHNAWTTSDGRFVWTTDERPNAPVASYDLSDKDNIRLLDEYRPFGSLNNGTIPHNAHVIDEWVSISYYTDGLRVIDGSKPDNLIEVANYDTWQGADGDFNGAWGAYPFLPSGLTLISDRQSGLFVVEVDYKLAARLEGTITDAAEGFPINNVEVVINAPQENGERTNAVGRYQTGLADAGTYTVTFTSPDYEELTVEVVMVNGACLQLDTTLVSATALFDVNYNITDAVTGLPITGAAISMEGRFGDFELTTDDQGSASVDGLRNNQLFDVTIAAWGYQAQQFRDLTASQLTNIEVALTPGYEDDFAADLGWTVTSSAASGNWVRANPIGTSGSGIQANPGADVANDIGNKAYVTGNGGGGAGTDDVDDGTVTLESPTFRAIGATTQELTVHFSYWFANFGGDPPTNDALTISISNGAETVEVKNYSETSFGWIEDSFDVTDFLALTDDMKFIISTGDEANTGHVVEAGLDRFFVTESFTAATDVVAGADVNVSVYPNPAAGPFTLTYDAPAYNDLSVRITDANGRLLQTRNVRGGAGTVSLGENLPSGFYLLELWSGSRRLYVGKAVRQ